MGTGNANVRCRQNGVHPCLRRSSLTCSRRSSPSLTWTSVRLGCPLRAYFDDVVFSHEVGFVKPDPEIYLTACERLGVEPGHCIFVGDGGSGELPGAAAVGMTPYCATWFSRHWSETDGEELYPPGARDYSRIATLSDLLPIVDAAR
jgi:FMN phosphatase YigB (HAD superfamily)